MPNLSSLSSVTTTATALSNLVLVTPQNTIGYQPISKPVATGPSAPNPPTLVFHYEGEQTVTIESDITDHYIEDNTSIQDQIALRPIVITTHGFIGELNDVAPSFLQPIQNIANKLTIISAYTPSLSVTALIAYAEAFQLYQVAQNLETTAISAWSSLSGSGGENVIGSSGIGSTVNLNTGQVSNNQTKQQTAFQQFFAYWNNRNLFTVQTPWAVFQNMAIQSVRAVQDADTRMITDFQVRFKMIRIASTATTTGTLAQILQGRLNAQASGTVDLGTNNVKPSIPLSTALGSQ